MRSLVTKFTLEFRFGEAKMPIAFNLLFIKAP